MWLVRYLVSHGTCKLSSIAGERVKERERERKRKRGRGREGEGEGEREFVDNQQVTGGRYAQRRVGRERVGRVKWVFFSWKVAGTGGGGWRGRKRRRRRRKVY